MGKGRLRQRELGQFLTPTPVADFMASLLTEGPSDIRLLDAGAGEGSLTAAAIRRICQWRTRPTRVAVTAYEVDQAMIAPLHATLLVCRVACQRVGIEFAATVHHADFIEAVVPALKGGLFGPGVPQFDAAIVNPPYRKIRSDSPARLALRSIGIETTNLYTGFLSLILRLLAPGGEMVAITPRSFCNGPYFRPFRQDLLSHVALRRLHVFESRSAAFRADTVLQENVVLHAVRTHAHPESVVVSTSSGRPAAAVRERRVPMHEVVSPQDSDQFIHLATHESHSMAKNAIKRLSSSLADLGLSVSTGRVVDFRVEHYLRERPTPGAVPLIYPCHFHNGFVEWPKSHGRKPNAIVDCEQTRDLLIPSDVYVLTKRFSPKEEPRRVVACVFDPGRVPGTTVGFENHLNYFHANGRGLKPDIARGLTAFLNSTIVDCYFRRFNGHTQVNAADLRNLRYPSQGQLEWLGQRVRELDGNQQELDRRVQEIFDARG